MSVMTAAMSQLFTFLQVLTHIHSGRGQEPTTYVHTMDGTHADPSCSCNASAQPLPQPVRAENASSVKAGEEVELLVGGGRTEGSGWLLTTGHIPMGCNSAEAIFSSERDSLRQRDFEMITGTHTNAILVTDKL